MSLGRRRSQIVEVLGCRPIADRATGTGARRPKTFKGRIRGRMWQSRRLATLAMGISPQAYEVDITQTINVLLDHSPVMFVCLILLVYLVAEAQT